MILLLTLPLLAQESTENGLPPALGNVDFSPRLQAQVPLSDPFLDESGKPVNLGDFLGDKPVVLALVYYTCPMLCDQVLDGIARSLRVVSLVPGEDYAVVAVSINPRETPQQAREKKYAVLNRYPKESAPSAWHLLTGTHASIARLAESVNFRYAQDPGSGMFAHAGGIVVLTPQGKVSRYFYGVQYAARDLQFALMDAADGKIGSTVDRLLLFCYEYDPATGKYGAAVLRLVRLGGLLSVAALAGLILLFRRRDRTESRKTSRIPHNEATS
jgi:protein SCO1/2